MLVKIIPAIPTDDIAEIQLNKQFVTIIDAEDFLELSKYHWRLKRSYNCYYAVARCRHHGKTMEIKMHRLIAKTPAGYECHHINHDTLDNRKSNLQNLSKNAHLCAHGKK